MSGFTIDREREVSTALGGKYIKSAEAFGPITSDPAQVIVGPGLYGKHDKPRLTARPCSWCKGWPVVAGHRCDGCGGVTA